MPKFIPKTRTECYQAVLEGTFTPGFFNDKNCAEEWMAIVLPNPFLAAYMIPALRHASK